jgi:uroporphyrinogen decarboxylase
MTNKERLRMVLDGQVPDVPPTWELVFQIEKEFFGIDPDPIYLAEYPSQEAKDRATRAYQVELSHRLVDELGWAAVPGGNDPEQVRCTKDSLGDKALVAGYEWGGVFWMPSGSDMVDFAVRLFESPAELHAEARRKCDQAKEHYARLADAGADFFVGAYDFGFNDAPFISPDHFRQFVTPYLAELVDTAHSLGKKILLHSDGCLTKILDQIHGTGIDGYQSVDPQGHMDIAEVRRQYPNWLLMGNVACNMLQDTDEEPIRRSVRYCMEHGGIGKRYIFSTSNCIFRGMPPQSYRTMLDEYHQCIARHRQAGCETWR